MNLDAQKWTDMLHWLRAKAKVASCTESWMQGEPKAVIDRIVAEIPDEIRMLEKPAPKTLLEEPSKLELYFLSKISELTEFLDVQQDDGSLRVTESILCLRDGIRTKRFLAGITDALDGFVGDEIHVCDAGSGAVPIMAVYAALTSPKVRATCIELNPHSAEIARQIVEALDLESRIKVVTGDATTYQPEPIDLLVSETMGSALLEEPIVKIMSNLTKYVKPNGIKLPSKIVIKSARLNVESKPKGFIKILKNSQSYFETEWHTVAVYEPGDNLQRISFTLPTTSHGKYVCLLVSEVHIGNRKINVYESLITTPNILIEPKGDPKVFWDGREIRVEYAPGDHIRNVTSYQRGPIDIRRLSHREDILKHS